jgi:hypothetical protein
MKHQEKRGKIKEKSNTDALSLSFALFSSFTFIYALRLLPLHKWALKPQTVLTPTAGGRT